MTWKPLVTSCALASAAALASGLPAEGADTDFSELSSHPELYIESTAIDPANLTRRNCQTEPGKAVTNPEANRPRATLGIGEAADLDASYDRPRFTNFIPNARASTDDRTHWKPEAPAVPAAAGTYEVSIYPCQTATSAQAARARDLLEQSLEAARRNGWFDHSKALADGFRLEHHGEHVHYVNPAYLNDGEILEPDKPEFLVFFEEEGEPQLAGFMYVMEGLYDRGPQIGGPLTVWHYHVMHPMCMKDGLTAGMPDAEGRCAQGERTTRSPEMLHAWFWKRDDGPFSSDMARPKPLRKAPDQSP